MDEILKNDVFKKELIEREKILMIWDLIFRFSDKNYQYSNLTLSSPNIDQYYSEYDFSMIRKDHKTKETKLIIGEYKNRTNLDADKFEKYKKEGILIELKKVDLVDTYKKIGCIVWYLCEFNEGLFLADITDIDSKNYPVILLECRKNNTYYDKTLKKVNLIPFSDGIFFPRNFDNMSLNLL